MYHFLQVWAEYSGNLVVNGGLGDASVVCRGFTGQRGCNGEPWPSFSRDKWFIDVHSKHERVATFETRV